MTASVKTYLRDLRPKDRNEVLDGFARHGIIFNPHEPLTIDGLAIGAFAKLEARLAAEDARGRSKRQARPTWVINRRTARGLQPRKPKTPTTAADGEALRRAELKRRAKAAKRLAQLPSIGPERA